ncbi:MAG: hypothetical protein ACTH2Y_04890 [Corynebacterium sp.]|uniref:hypothetical protein n=1 Tax=unclassified Corynebacterium TaxID=2624378 RepID=UPI003F8E892D
MNEKFKEFTGGMSLTVAAAAVIVIAAVYISTAGSSEWVTAAAVVTVGLIVAALIRITGSGRQQGADTGGSAD